MHGCTVIQPNQGEARWLAGDKLRFLLGSDQTAGAYSMAEIEVYPGGGPPPHLHTREDELFYIVDGELGFVHDQTTFRAGKGFAAHLLKNITHTFKGVAQTPARTLVLALPGGFDRFAAAASAPWTGPRAPSEEDLRKLVDVCPRFGVELRPTWQADKTIEPKTDNREFWVFGQHVKLKLTSNDTNGQTSVAELTLQPGPGVPLHAHVREDEMFYVLEGTCTFDLAGTRIPAGAGGFVYVPKGVMHAMFVTGRQPAKLVDYHLPAGFENFFIEAGTPCADRSKPPSTPIDLPKAIASMRKHGMTLPAGVS